MTEVRRPSRSQPNLAAIERPQAARQSEKTSVPDQERRARLATRDEFQTSPQKSHPALWGTDAKAERPAQPAAPAEAGTPSTSDVTKVVASTPSAINSTLNLTTQVSTRMVQGLGAASGVLTAVRIPGATDNVITDFEKAVETPTFTNINNFVESDLKLLRDSLRVAQGVEAVAELAGRKVGRWLPGVNLALAAVDTNIATAVILNRDTGATERTAAVLTAAFSWGAATSVPILSQAAALAAIGFSIWRDHEAGERREKRKDP